MGLRLVPFNEAWINHSKLDLKAIYLRPRVVQDAYGEWHRETNPAGMPTWDTTTPLPVRQHNRWTSKGFRYVTLADRDSLVRAAKEGTIAGSWRDYDQHQSGGPWNWRKYSEGQDDLVTAEFAALQQDVATYGADTVETLRRRTDPSFVLPEALKAIKPAKKGAA